VAIVRNEDILRLDITMHVIARVKRRDSLYNGPDYAQRANDVAAISFDVPGKFTSVEIFHHDPALRRTLFQ